MTTVACGKCGRPGIICECTTATARGPLFGIPSLNYGKWDPEKASNEPLTMKRLREAWDRLEEKRRSWTKYCPMCGSVPEGHCHWVSPELYRMYFDAENCEVKFKAYSAAKVFVGMADTKTAPEAT